MLSIRPLLGLGTLVSLAALMAGCGGSGSSSSSSSPTSSRSTTAAAGGSGPGALSAEARSAATGDIPDNQNFLTYRDRKAGYSLVYPEGWAIKGSGGKVSFSNNNNVVRVVVARSRATLSTDTAAAQLRALQRRFPSLRFTAPRTIMLPSGPAVKATYSTLSAPSPVTGKRVLLLVDRYQLSHAGRVATIDLGTPKGVDNVDAYRMIVHRFRWRS
jgi:hypothetical protein